MAKGGARPGAGRKTLKTEREIKEQLQKQLPAVEEAIKDSLRAKDKKDTVRTTSAYKLLAKFVGDLQAVKVTGDEDAPVGVVVLPPLKKKTDSKETDIE